ncbi:MAG: PilN domain-containing protein, partial [Candidatus Omnitrophica bacterium]|nr:PilN domain-containing protein [Candidatus Omnitrophota bacterium]
SVRARKNLIRETVLISLVFVGSLSLAFSSHWQALKWREEKINREIQKLSPMVDEVKRIISTLQLIEELKLSKIGILQFLKEISTKVPSSIVFRQIKMEKDEFIFKGESPSHGEISDVVENLQEIPFIRDVKLEHTRLRKRLNLDYFEFEVGGFIRANSKLHRRLEERASQSKNEVLASMWELIARKADYEKEWGKFKDRMEKPHDQWTKTFLDYSQKESVLFEKIEPESESRLYLLFGGDITQLLRFFYYLLEKEPLTQIESFSIRQDDEIKGLIYEITLAKNAP